MIRQKLHFPGINKSWRSIDRGPNGKRLAPVLHTIAAVSFVGCSSKRYASFRHTRWKPSDQPRDAAAAC